VIADWWNERAGANQGQAIFIKKVAGRTWSGKRIDSVTCSSPFVMNRPVSLTIERITQEALALPPDKRSELIEKLALSLEPSPLSESWANVAASRLDDLRSGRVQPIDEDEVNAQILKIVNGED
jgi:putative addiction module component (TIGR02574 family)